MGFFREIKCDYPLPDTKFQREDFQTKSLNDRRFSHCFITKDGKLMIDDADIEFHGMIEFYTFYEKEFYEYSAKFTDGRIVEVKRI